MFHSFMPCRRRLCLAAVLVALTLAPATVSAQQFQQDPFGDCCVASVVMSGVSAWTATCGSCATNPGTYVIRQPDPEKLVFLGPGGISAESPNEAARAICNCPSQDARRAWEEKMRTFDGH